MTALKIYRTRNDHEPGYVYLIEAIGYHGILPGCYLRRCKIGLSRNPQARLDTFHDNQPPCDLRLLRTIYVRDMEEVESRLYKQFRDSNVKLKKSREWFDLKPWEFLQVQWMFDRYEKLERLSTKRAVPMPVLISLGLTALLVLGVGVGVEIKEQSAPSLQQKINK